MMPWRAKSDIKEKKEMATGGGSETIPAFASEIEVTHGLGGVPNLLLITHQDDPNGRDSKVDDARVTSTVFYIEIDSPDGVAHDFYWYGST